MSETSIRRRASLKRSRIEQQGRTATTSTVTINADLANPASARSYPPVLQHVQRSSEDIVDVAFDEREMRNGSAYQQLPSGLGPSPKKNNRSTSSGLGFGLGLAKWQRNALIGVAALMVFMYLASSSRVSPTSSRSGKEASDYKQDNQVTPEDGVVQKPDWKEQVVGGEDTAPIDTAVSGGGKKMAPPPNAPGTNGISPQTGSSAAACLLPPGKPEIQYALMIDAGSTGSRMHVYTFSNCLPEGVSPSDPQAKNALPTLKGERFFPITPGLSSYKGNPQAAAKSLLVIMQQALSAVPEKERACTPIAVKATAGLRLLGKKESQDILDEVQRYLTEEWPFHVIEDGVVIMDGKDEGVYAWITINYVRLPAFQDPG